MSSSERSATVKASDMTEDMQQDATGTAIQVGPRGAIGGGGAAVRRQSTCRAVLTSVPIAAPMPARRRWTSSR